MSLSSWTSTVKATIDNISKALSLNETQTNLLLAIISGYSFGKTSASKYIKRFSAPIVVVLLTFRAYQIKDVDDNHRVTLLSTLQALIKALLPQSQTLARVLGILFEDAAGLAVFLGVLGTLNSLSFNSFSDFKKSLVAELYEHVKVLPQVQNILNAEKKKLEDEFEKDLKVKSREIGGVNTKLLSQLPQVGIPHEQILELMSTVTTTENVTWETGRISGAVYHGVKSHQDFLNQAFGFYSISNPLHPDVWPSAMKYESEIIAMTASLVRGGVDTVCGSTTSGGTESIILAIKSHRDYYTKKYSIKHPELIACITAHAAVDKACDLMGIKLIKVPMDPVTCRVDVAAVRRAIGPNTIMMYSSAPNYPQGAIDDIPALGKLAVSYGIGLHVDCCLGGFFLPFAKKLGYSIPGN